MQRLRVVEGDITKLDVDAIVNAANERMLGGGGVDGAIHHAAGPELYDACLTVPELRPDVRCPTGEARLTEGFGLPTRHVIHTVGPIWSGGDSGEADLLASAYRSCLEIACTHGMRTIAFPALSCGVYGYPIDQAAEIAVHEIRAFQAANDRPEQVLLVAFDAAMAQTLRERTAEAHRDLG